MTLADKILVLVAFAGLIVFNGVVLWFVRVPDLIIVVSLVLFLAFYDFWVSVFRKPKE